METLSVFQRRSASFLLLLFAVFVLVLAGGSVAAAQTASAGQPDHGAEPPSATAPAGHDQAGAPPHGEAAEGHAEEGHEGEHHEEPLWKTGARLFNFLILAGTLVYFLRAPMREFFDGRIQAVRSDLVKAAEMRAAAAAQLQSVEEKLRALPGELQAIREKGAADIEAERARIRSAAEAERERLTAQARAQASMRVRAAARELTASAVERIMASAEARIRTSIGEEDHARLIERYLDRVPAAGRSIAADGGAA